MKSPFALSLVSFLFASSLLTSSAALAAHWQPVTHTKLMGVYVGDADNVFGIDTANGLLRRTGDTWTSVPLKEPVATMDVAGNHIVVVTTNGRVLSGAIGKEGRPRLANVKLPKGIESVAAAEVDERGNLWLLDTGGRLLRRGGGGGWIFMPVKGAMSVSVSPDGLNVSVVDVGGRVLTSFDGSDIFIVDVGAPDLGQIVVGGILGKGDKDKPGKDKDKPGKPGKDKGKPGKPGKDKPGNPGKGKDKPDNPGKDKPGKPGKDVKGLVVMGIGGNNVYRRSDNGWFRVDGPPMRQISIGADGSIFATGPNDANNVWNYVE